MTRAVLDANVGGSPGADALDAGTRSVTIPIHDSDTFSSCRVAPPPLEVP